METKQTAVEWLIVQIINDHNKNALTGVEWKKIFEQAKQMESEQTEQKDSVISQIDLELSLIEDYAKGEVGNAITLLRKKIANYYETNGYK